MKHRYNNDTYNLQFMYEGFVQPCSNDVLLEFIAPGAYRQELGAAVGEAGSKGIRAAGSAIKDTAVAAADKAKATVSTVNNAANFAGDVWDWFPKMMSYVKSVGFTLLGVNLLSMIFKYVGNKINTVDEKDIKKMYSMAPPEIQRRFDELAQIKDSDPDGYQAGIRQLRDYALADLKKKLEAKGVQVEDSTLGTILTKLGSFGTSFLGSIFLTGIIFVVMNYLGIYTPPAFPTLPNK